ncbi:peptidylprolyl isomerase [candidate division GN15 bacterium]|nr:peptidylprolyl isomerase [candidate division GN15 bacterium]
MAQAQQGNTVTVHYTGKLEDGTVFDSSQGRDPLVFKIGDGRLIPGFEAGTVGMAEGEKKTVTVPPDQAYGDRRDDLTLEVAKGNFPENIDPQVGQQFEMQQPGGQSVNVTVTQVEGDKVTVDANHPLAGKTLVFEIEMVKVA